MKSKKSIFRSCVIFCFLLILNTVYADYITDHDYDILASKFFPSEMYCVYDSLAKQTISNPMRNIKSYTENHEYNISHDATIQTNVNKILIIVKDNVYSAISTYIIRYAHDIHNAWGCAVDIVSVDGETAPQIRTLIQSYSTNLTGAVLIGDIAPAIYYHADTIIDTTLWVADYFPCDLYYMDTNGVWTLKSDGSGWYDNHTGDVKPEIFVGRINTAYMGKDELQELKYYFDKNHQYWTGKIILNKQKALTFTGPDWNNSTFRDCVSPLYGANYYDAIYGSMFTKNTYINFLQNSNYEFIQLACHSGALYHNFGTSDAPSNLPSVTIASLNTKQIGYNLFCCHACNWMSSSTSKCLGESYLYGLENNSSALVIVGSTKTGGMLGFYNFYAPLGNGNCMGNAFTIWWLLHCGASHTAREKLWFYGMTILGDPLINFNFTNECDDVFFINYGEESTNHMYYAQSKIVVLDYSVTQGKSVTLSAPTIQINGPFTCDSFSTFNATPQDNCVCNNNSKYFNRKVKKYFTEQSTYGEDINPIRFLFYVYPNPAKDFINVQYDGLIEKIFVFNFNGQCILQTTQTRIDISHLPQGVYIIRAIAEDGQILQSKLIHE